MNRNKELRKMNSYNGDITEKGININQRGEGQAEETES